MGETYYFKLRCLYPSVCLFVRPSVRHHFVSTLFISNPWWDLQTTQHKCQVDDSMYVWPKSVQGQGHSSRLNIACFRPFSKFNNSDYHYNKLDASFPMLQSMVYSIPGACLDDFCVYALLLGGSGGMLPRKNFLLHNAVGAFWGVFKHKK